MSKPICAALALLVMTGMGAEARAESGQVLNEKNFSAQSFADALMPKAEQMQTRSIGIQSKPSRPPEANVDITFANGSAILTSSSKRMLDKAAAAMQADTLKPFKFEIDGHTDISGSPQKNLQLSERRAKSVVSYLETRHGISNRLSAVGKGSAEPLVASDPASPANRRVSFVNKGMADNE
ncbi:MAG: OmpA family protein [Pseudomonadota bacterium]